MEKKFYYFGVRMKEVVVDATGTSRQKEKAVFCPKVYASAAEACASAAKAMESRLGVSFFVQGFEKQLNIDAQGISHGFKA